MPNIKIKADYTANLLQLSGVDFAVAPLKILAGDQEFVDDASLDTNAMVQWFDSYKGRSKTSCPNTADWLHAFGDAEADETEGRPSAQGRYGGGVSLTPLFQPQFCPQRHNCGFFSF